MSPASPRAAPRSRSSDKDGGTLLTYNVEAQIGGKLAQLGQRLINSAAKKTADDFFNKFGAGGGGGWGSGGVIVRDNALDRPRARVQS